MTGYDDLHVGDHITITRSARTVGDPRPTAYTGTLTALTNGRHGHGGTLLTVDGPVTLDLDSERMLRLYGVTQTITRH